ncbi:PRC-barrel domain containing protein [Halovivax gelatinilyticus]|uniref:PRC-barrel domain containing protein n=1 Tax=Halovivax gelatinilyticus TaxID=2961597 RepID=UPI0020CA6F30|nr:PRC-barrel domain containing protein [Halovivax gelatinilyticus]
MCASFSDDDVGKTVVNASGEEVGLVSAVEHDTLRVKPDPGITDSIKAALGWEGTSENTYPLQEESIDRITDDEIRLTGGFQEGERSAAGGTSPSGRDTTGEAGVGTESGRTGGESGIDTDHDDSGLMDTDIGDDDDELIDTDIGDDESGLMDSDRSEPRHEEGLSGGPGDGRTDESSGSEIGTGSETGARGDVGSDMGSGGREGGMSDVGDRSDRSRADRDSGMGDADDDELIDTDIGDDDDDLLDSDDDDDELIDTDIGDDDDDLLDSDDDRRTRDSDR